MYVKNVIREMVWKVYVIRDLEETTEPSWLGALLYYPVSG